MIAGAFIFYLWEILPKPELCQESKRTNMKMLIIKNLKNMLSSVILWQESNLGDFFNRETNGNLMHECYFNKQLKLNSDNKQNIPNLEVTWCKIAFMMHKT